MEDKKRKTYSSSSSRSPTPPPKKSHRHTHKKSSEVHLSDYSYYQIFEIIFCAAIIIGCFCLNPAYGFIALIFISICALCDYLMKQEVRAIARE